MRNFFRGQAYSVGDGFCYEGIIKNECNNKYHFVIDCGNKTPVCRKKWKGKLSKKDCDNRLDEITDGIALNGNHIDLFILTHLHEDHYSGYEKLFNKTSIDLIIMPYLYPEERLYLIMDERLDDDDAIFLANPYSTILDMAMSRNDDVKLVLIRGNSDHKDDFFQDNIDSADEVWGENHEDYNEIIEIENLDKKHVQVVRALTSGRPILKNTWMFKFFNIEVDKKDVDVLKKMFGNLTASNLYSKITNTAEKTIIYNQYNYIASKKLSNNLNNTSIVTYHAPVEIHGRSGTLLTGDISFKGGIADKIMYYFNEQMDKIGLFSLPHHGSEDNWDDKFTINGNMDSIVCFASTHNYYGNRLTCKMISALRCHNISVLVVDENRLSEIYQYITPFHHEVYKICKGKKLVQIMMA